MVYLCLILLLLCFSFFVLVVRWMLKRKTAPTSKYTFRKIINDIHTHNSQRLELFFCDWNMKRSQAHTHSSAFNMNTKFRCLNAKYINFHVSTQTIAVFCVSSSSSSFLVSMCLLQIAIDGFVYYFANVDESWTLESIADLLKFIYLYHCCVCVFCY